MAYVDPFLTVDAAIVRHLLSEISDHFTDEIDNPEQWKRLSSNYQELERHRIHGDEILTSPEYEDDQYDFTSLIPTISKRLEEYQSITRTTFQELKNYEKEDNYFPPLFPVLSRLRKLLQQYRTLIIKKKENQYSTYSIAEMMIERRILRQMRQKLDILYQIQRDASLKASRSAKTNRVRKTFTGKETLAKKKRLKNARRLSLISSPTYEKRLEPQQTRPLSVNSSWSSTAEGMLEPQLVQSQSQRQSLSPSPVDSLTSKEIQQQELLLQPLPYLDPLFPVQEILTTKLSSPDILKTTTVERPHFVKHFDKPCIRKEWTVNFDSRSRLKEGYIKERYLKRCLIEREKNTHIQVPSLCVWGPGGTGKTVALRAICHDLDVITHYEDGIHYFDLGLDIEESSIIEKIILRVRNIEKIGLGDEVSTHQYTLQRKKILIVLDNVWSRECSITIQRLANLLPQGKVLFSTRDRRLLQVKNTKTIFIKFTYLPPKERASLNIIKHQLSEGDKLLTDLSPEAYNALHNLLEKCGGLKICLSVAGSCLERYIQECGNNVNVGLISYVQKLDEESRIIFDESRTGISYINSMLDHILPPYDWDDKSVKKRLILQNAHKTNISASIDSNRWGVRMSHDGRYAVTVSQRNIFMSDLYETHVGSFSQTETESISCVDVSVKGQVAYGTMRGNLFLQKQGFPARKIVIDDDSAINLVNFSFDGIYVATGSTNKPIQIRDLLSPQHICYEMNELFTQPLPSAISCIAFSKDNSHVVSGSPDGTIRVADCKKNSSAKDIVFRGHSERVVYISIRGQGEYVVSGSLDGTIRLARIKTDKLMHSWRISERMIEEVQKSGAWPNALISEILFLEELASSEYQSDLPVVLRKLKKLLVQNQQPKSNEGVLNGYEYLMDLMKRSWGCTVISIGDDEQSPKKRHLQGKEDVVRKAATSYNRAITFYSNTGKEFILLLGDQPLGKDAFEILLRYVPGSEQLLYFLRTRGANIDNCFLRALNIPISNTTIHSKFYIHPTWLSLLEEGLEDFLQNHCESHDSEIWAGFLCRTSKILLKWKKNESKSNRKAQLGQKRVSDTSMKDGSFFVVEEDKFIKWVLRSRTTWLLTGADIGTKLTAGAKFGVELKTEVEGTLMLSRGPEYQIQDDLRHANTAVIANIGVLNELYPSKEDASRPELDERIIALSKALLQQSLRMPKNQSYLYDAIVEEPTCDLVEFTKWYGKHAIAINKLNHSTYYVVDSSNLRQDELQLLRTHAGDITNATGAEQTFFFVMDTKNVTSTRIIYKASQNNDLLCCNGAHPITIPWPIKQNSFDERVARMLL